ncbi:MAG: PKD domain-containing protein [Saprospiraceae bacterium]
MKSQLKFVFFTILVGSLQYLSCKKDLVSLREVNKPPIANAGTDQKIQLPIDSVHLDGSASSDPDGNIINFLWTKIAGPVSFTIVNATLSRTTLKNLVHGSYQFELIVKNEGGLSAKDTMNITVDSALIINHDPIANAGPDRNITLPTNTVILDGSGSTDMDNNITAYTWTKLSGPSSFNIINSNEVQTQVTNLVVGTYQFELKVTDAGGLFSYDAMELTVWGAAVLLQCTNRQEISATLVQIGTLSEPRIGLEIASLGNKIFIAGGQTTTGYSSRVDIYDITTNTWSTTELSKENRMGMAVAVVGNKILFAGGAEHDTGIHTSRVDIYDGSTNTWSTAELSKARADLAAATIGNKVFFAGGSSFEPYITGSNVVDIYDNSTNTWTTAALSEGRGGLSATTAGNKIYFAGGVRGGGSGNQNVSTRIDIYDATTNSWSTSELMEARTYHAGIAVAGKIYWGSGINFYPSYSYFTLSSQVEVRDINTGVSSLTCMSPRYFLNAVTKGDNIIFFTGIDIGDRFEIYNSITNTWSTVVLNQKIVYSAIISVNNTIYIAGGDVNGIASNKVWKLEF